MRKKESVLTVPVPGVSSGILYLAPCGLVVGRCDMKLRFRRLPPWGVGHCSLRLALATLGLVELGGGDHLPLRASGFYLSLGKGHVEVLISISCVRLVVRPVSGHGAARTRRESEHPLGGKREEVVVQVRRDGGKCVAPRDVRLIDIYGRPEGDTELACGLHRAAGVQAAHADA